MIGYNRHLLSAGWPTILSTSRPTTRTRGRSVSVSGMRPVRLPYSRTIREARLAVSTRNFSALLYSYTPATQNIFY